MKLSEEADFPNFSLDDSTSVKRKWDDDSDSGDEVVCAVKKRRTHVLDDDDDDQANKVDSTEETEIEKSSRNGSSLDTNQMCISVIEGPESDDDDDTPLSKLNVSKMSETSGGGTTAPEFEKTVQSPQNSDDDEDDDNLPLGDLISSGMLSTAGVLSTANKNKPRKQKCAANSSSTIHATAVEPSEGNAQKTQKRKGEAKKGKGEKKKQNKENEGDSGKQRKTRKPTSLKSRLKEMTLNNSVEAAQAEVANFSEALDASSIMNQEDAVPSSTKRKDKKLLSIRQKLEKAKQTKQKKKQRNTANADSPVASANQEPLEFREPVDFTGDLSDVEQENFGGAGDMESAHPEWEMPGSESNPKKRARKQGKKEPKQKLPKEKKETKKERKQKEQEMLDIYSENQRLLRETSVKLPYHKPSKCSLQEFLKERQQSPLPFVAKPPKADINLILSLKSDNHRYKCDSTNLHTSEESSTSDLRKELDKVSNSEELHPESDVNLKAAEDVLNSLICVLEATTSCLGTTEQAEEIDDAPDENVTNAEKAMEVSEAVSLTCDRSNSSHAAVRSTDKQVSEEEHEVTEQQTEASNELPLLIIPDCTGNNAMPHADRKPTLKELIAQASKQYTPHLSGSPQKVIDLSNDSCDHKKNDLANFIEKFVTHTKEISKKRKAQDVKLSIVTKDDDDKLKMSEIHVTSGKTKEEEDEERALERPGAKYLKLKEKLFDKILEKKEALLMKRRELEKLDNEEDLDQEEEEAEMTDGEESERSITDDEHVSGEEEEEEDDDEEDDDDDDILNVSLRKKKRNMFIDDEASESGDDIAANAAVSDGGDDDDDDDLHSRESAKSKSSGISQMNFSGIFPKADLCEDACSTQIENSNPDGGKDSEKKKHSRLLYLDSDSEDDNSQASSAALVHTSLDLDGSTIPPYQPGGGFRHLNTEEPDISTNQLDSTANDVEQEKGKSLCRANSVFNGSQQLWPSQDLPEPSTSRNSAVSAEPVPCIADLVRNSSPGKPDDLLSLCSGRFSDCASFTASHSQGIRSSAQAVQGEGGYHDGVGVSSSRMSCSKAPESVPNIDGLINSLPGNADDLLALCSGKFPESQDASSALFTSTEQSNTTNSHLPSRTGKMEDFFSRQNTSVSKATELSALNEEESDRMSVLSEPLERRKKGQQLVLSESEPEEAGLLSEPLERRKKGQQLVLSDSEPEEAGGDGVINDDDRLSIGSQFSDDFTEDADNEETAPDIKQNKEVREFFENEAELSGSDVGSEDEDEDAYDGEYEQDMIEDDVQYSEEDLRNQIGKVHLKNILDEDKRELRLYQELYLEDGELHMDGPGRQRKFVWRNSGDFALDGIDGLNSESGEEEDLPEEESWRIERHEREKWLRQCKEKELSPENSPVKIQRRESMRLEIVSKVKDQDEICVNKPVAYGIQDEMPLGVKKVSRGSLLARGQDFLAGLAKKIKKMEGDATGSRTTKHFVFRAISPKKEKKEDAAMSHKALASNISTTKAMISNTRSVQITRKKGEKKRRSVFDYLN